MWYVFADEEVIVLHSKGLNWLIDFQPGSSIVAAPLNRGSRGYSYIEKCFLLTINLHCLFCCYILWRLHKYFGSIVRYKNRGATYPITVFVPFLSEECPIRNISPQKPYFPRVFCFLFMATCPEFLIGINYLENDE